MPSELENELLRRQAHVNAPRNWGKDAMALPSRDSVGDYLINDPIKITGALARLAGLLMDKYKPVRRAQNVRLPNHTGTIDPRLHGER